MIEPSALDHFKELLDTKPFSQEIHSFCESSHNLDSFLTSFLRYKNDHVKSAMKMLQNYWQFRSEKIGTTRLTAQDIRNPLLSKFISIPGTTDMESRQMVIVFFDRILENHLEQPEILKTIWYFLENMMELSIYQEQGICLVSIFENSMSSGNKGLVELMFESIQNKVPVKLGSVFLINPPPWLRFFWALSSNFMKSKLVKRVKLLSGDYQEQLFEMVGKESLVSELGGDLDFDQDAWLRAFYPDIDFPAHRSPFYSLLNGSIDSQVKLVCQ
ncbi:CRAL/TRIO domain-containing protein [Basidiobolus meristosporus CBS 931.73]|uniref:CRAL/TRIO domain-containing protein n=1 Tax=Basidiobolus meristosporus CBS 931.73 TaxID=1314790 RepID=A0A1Y1XZA5_9FUNG|nr:CRAL/TRIO domain-containing protein [Basidiobolus meristosporus CBS 931.73]|eukprot:ORX90985.1 CRAL/TRIO domain-containing protein [Basidiobolus meristosporus CBS 931.73]